MGSNLVLYLERLFVFSKFLSASYLEFQIVSLQNLVFLLKCFSNEHATCTSPNFHALIMCQCHPSYLFFPVFGRKENFHL